MTHAPAAAGRLARHQRALALGFVLALALAWFASVGHVPAYVLPPPGEVAAAVLAFASSAQRLPHLFATLAHIASAIVISFVLGALLAFAAHYARWSAPAMAP